MNALASVVISAVTTCSALTNLVLRASTCMPASARLPTMNTLTDLCVFVLLAGML